MITGRLAVAVESDGLDEYQFVDDWLYRLFDKTIRNIPRHVWVRVGINIAPKYRYHRQDKSVVRYRGIIHQHNRYLGPIHFYILRMPKRSAEDTIKATRSHRA